MISLHWLDIDSSSDFPPVKLALTEPDGLLAAGGDLSTERLLKAYQHGIFPWYSQDEPILWWSPNPRFVLYPGQLKISRSLKKNIRNNPYRVTMDTAFDQVITQCSRQPRPGQAGTWISDEMLEAYQRMHRLGHAHSVEVWEQDELVGGLYGMHVGPVFCGESMFSRRSNTSKVALYHLCQFLIQQGFVLIDSQVYTEHLESLGAVMIPREEYIKTLQQPTAVTMPANWSALFQQYMETTRT